MGPWNIDPANWPTTARAFAGPHSLDHRRSGGNPGCLAGWAPSSSLDVLGVGVQQWSSLAQCGHESPMFFQWRLLADIARRRGSARWWAHSVAHNAVDWGWECVENLTQVKGLLRAWKLLQLPRAMARDSTYRAFLEPVTKLEGWEHTAMC